MVKLVKRFQTELMVEIYSKSLVRAIGNVLLMKFTRSPINIHKDADKWPLFVNKQLFQWSASITLDNKSDVLTDFSFLSLYTLPHTSFCLTGCISIVFSVLNILTHLTTKLPVGSPLLSFLCYQGFGHFDPVEG